MKIRILILFGIFAIGVSGCSSSSPKEQTLIIFHAGSVSKPIHEVSEAFQKLHPGVKILHEAAGSVESARKIIDLKKPCDLFVSADISVIEKFLWPQYTKEWYGFAGNSIGIAFTQQSRCAAEIGASNWHELLLRDDVNFARSDPQADPCGYRTLFVWQLAEKFYSKPGIYKKMAAKDQRFIRPKETDLLMLLQTHNVDYIFIYRSVAKQHGLKFVELPDSINLSNPQLEEYYHNASLNLRGKNPNDSIKQQGNAIVYGVTIPQNALNRQLAQEYLRFLLDRNLGLRIFREAGHTLPDSVLIFPAKTK